MRLTGANERQGLRSKALEPVFAIAARDCIGTIATRAANGLLKHPSLAPPVENFGTPEARFELADMVQPLSPPAGPRQLHGYVDGMQASNVTLDARALRATLLPLGAGKYLIATTTIKNYGVRMEIDTPGSSTYLMRMDYRGNVSGPFRREDESRASFIADKVATAALIGHGVALLTDIPVDLRPAAELHEALQERYEDVVRPAAGQPFWTAARMFSEYADEAPSAPV